MCWFDPARRRVGWGWVCIEWCIIVTSMLIISIEQSESDYGVNISVTSVVISQTVLSTRQLSHSTGQPLMAHNPKKEKRPNICPHCDNRLQVVPLSLSPSCVKRKKFARKKWPREILGARSVRKAVLPPKPKSLAFHGRVIFWCRISHLDVLLLSPVINSPGRSE